MPQNAAPVDTLADENAFVEIKEAPRGVGVEGHHQGKLDDRRRRKGGVLVLAEELAPAGVTRERARLPRQRRERGSRRSEGIHAARLLDRVETNARYAPLVKRQPFAALALFMVVVVACFPESTPAPSATPTPTTVARPRFELATYMYALQTKGKIRIGALDNAAPFSSRGSNGRYSGFEPDLGRELAKAIFGPQQDIDAVIEWISVGPSTAVNALTSLQADVVIARLPITDERAAVIDLTNTYFVTGERLLVRSTNDEIKDLADLDTKTVCVQNGSGVDAHVEDANDSARTLALDTYNSCLGALQQGQVDAIGADEVTLWRLIGQDPNTKIVGHAVVEERYGIGAKKNTSDRQGFLLFLNTWLAAVIRDGTWSRLYAQDIAPLSKETKTNP